MAVLSLIILVCCSATYAEVILNVLHINENKMSAPNMGILIAEENIRLNMDLKYKLWHVSGEANNYPDFFNRLCITYEELLKNNTAPTVIVDTSQYGVISEGAKAFSRKLGIPTMTSSYGSEGDLLAWQSLNSKEERYLVQILPHIEIIPEIIRSITIYQGYSTVAVLADENYILEHKYKSLLQNLQTRHIIMTMNMMNPVGQLLHMKKVNIFNIFLMGKLSSIKMFLDSADAISMFTKRYSFHALTHEMGDLECECKQATVLFARTIMAPQYMVKYAFINSFPAYVTSKLPLNNVVVGFYYDLFIHTLLAARKMYSDAKIELEPYLKCSDYNGTNSPVRDLDLKRYFMKKYHDFPSYGPFNISKNGFSSSDFTMDLRAITFRDGTRYSSVTVGSWTTGFNNLLNVTDSFTLKKYNPRVEYRVVALIQEPMLYLDPDNSSRYIGYCIDVMDEMAKVLNFEYSVVPGMDGKEGHVVNGFWNGVINEIVYKRADIALGGLHVTEERENAVEFTVPFYDLDGHLILMKYHKTSSSWFRFLGVFEEAVWFSIIFVYFIASVLIWLLFKFSPFGAGYIRTANRKDLRVFTLKECLWFCLISLTPQGGGECTVNASSRFVTLIWWFFGFIIVSSYSANLSAYLLVSRIDAPVKSLDDLAAQYKIAYSTINESSTMEYFRMMAAVENKLFLKWKELSLFENMSDIQRSKLGVWTYPLSEKYTKIWTTIQKTGLLSSNEEALQKIRSSDAADRGFALLTNAIDARYLEMTNCDLQTVGEEFNKRPLAIAVQKTSPLKDLFNNVMLDLYNKRVIQKIKEKWWKNNPNRAECEIFGEAQGIGMENMAGIFMYLFIGILLLLIMLALQLLLKKVLNI